MAFETFSLADILRNAEIINRSRSQSNLDILRGRALEEGIETSNLQQRSVKQSLEQQEELFDEDKKRRNTKWLIGATDQILASPDPQAAAIGFVPEGQRRGVIAPDVDTSQPLDLEGLRQMNQRARVALGESPGGGERIKVGKDETIIDEQGNVIFSNFDAKNRIDEQTEQRLKTEAGLRKEFNGLTDDFRQIADSYGRILESADDPSAAGDLALIFNYMKMLDPGSTVREGEFATAQGAAGVPGRIVSLYNNILRGERMNVDQRNDFVGRSNRLFQSQLRSAQDTADAFEKVAKDAGVKVENVIAVFSERKDQPRALETPTEASINKLRSEARADPELVRAFINRFGVEAVPADLKELIPKDLR